MKTREMLSSSVQRETNRQAWTCIAVIVTVWCISAVVLGATVWFLLSQKIHGMQNEQLAFVSDRDGNPEIYTINADGSGTVRLTNDPAGDFHPSWAPDGARIAFWSERDGNAEIYMMNADGSDVIRLTNHPAEDYDPAWSPDGTQIIFHSHRYQGRARLFVMDADGSKVKRLTHPEWDDWSPVWSPDGTQIVFNSSRFNNRDIWLMNADGSETENLTDNPADDWWPDWSPDGTRIVFHSDRDGGFDVFSMKSDGSDVLRLTSSRAADFDPVWSPDGNYIAFTSDRAGNSDVWIMKADGSNPTQVTDHLAQDWAPAWKPNGITPLIQPEMGPKEEAVQANGPNWQIKHAEPGINLAYGKSVTVSQALADHPARMAVDGHQDSWWAAGASAPQWLQIDLGANYMIAEVWLLPSQVSAGRTIHHLFAMGPATDNDLRLLHTFEGPTTDNNWLTIKFPEPLQGIRFIRIETAGSPSWISWREIEVIAGE